MKIGIGGTGKGKPSGLVVYIYNADQVTRPPRPSKRMFHYNATWHPVMKRLNVQWTHSLNRLECWIILSLFSHSTLSLLLAISNLAFASERLSASHCMSITWSCHVSRPSSKSLTVCLACWLFSSRVILENEAFKFYWLWYERKIWRDGCRSRRCCCADFLWSSRTHGLVGKLSIMKEWLNTNDPDEVCRGFLHAWTTICNVYLGSVQPTLPCQIHSSSCISNLPILE